MITSKSWKFQEIIDSSPNFQAIPRVQWNSPNVSALIKEFDRDQSCRPLIIEGYQNHPQWPKSLFNADYLLEQGPQDISVRNVYTRADQTMPLKDFIVRSRRSPSYATPGETERLYGKDAECPPEWDRWIHGHGFLPPLLLPCGPHNLLNNLPKSATVETLMCYLGIGDTYTPSHKDLCASSGQNLMCYTEAGGSSFWFMTQGSDTPEVDRFFLGLAQELDHETRVLSIEELATAPFTVYIGEQKLGDLVLVPPRSCHQVVNYGGITIKTSWSRMTVKGLVTAYFHELPLYRRVCRVETYRVKSIILYTLLQKASTLKELTIKLVNTSSLSRQSGALGIPGITRTGDTRSSGNDALPLEDLVDLVAEDLKCLVDVYACILQEEDCGTSVTFDHHAADTPRPDLPALDPRRYESVDGYFICDYCAADIFETYFECKTCSTDPPEARVDSDGRVEGFIICSGCYVEGRSCMCRDMRPGQFFPFEYLRQDLQEAITVIQQYAEARSLHYEFRNKGDQSGISRAACYLYQHRQRVPSSTRKCRYLGNLPSHDSPSDSMLSCKKCHSGKCFSHLLSQQRVHSTAALIAMFEGATKSHERYHNMHMCAKEQYTLAVDGLIQAEKFGSQPDLFRQLSSLALAHGVCKPSNSLVTPGWYDRHVQLISEEQTTEAPNTTVSSLPLPSGRLAPTTMLVNAVFSDDLSDLPSLTPSPAPDSSSLTDPVASLPVERHDLKFLKRNLLGVVVPLSKKRKASSSSSIRPKGISPSTMHGNIRVAKRSLGKMLPTPRKPTAGPPRTHPPIAPQSRVVVRRTQADKRPMRQSRRRASEQLPQSIARAYNQANKDSDLISPSPTPRSSSPSQGQPAPAMATARMSSRVRPPTQRPLGTDPPRQSQPRIRSSTTRNGHRTTASSGASDEDLNPPPLEAGVDTTGREPAPHSQPPAPILPLNRDGVSLGPPTLTGLQSAMPHSYNPTLDATSPLHQRHILAAQYRDTAAFYLSLANQISGEQSTMPVLPMVAANPTSNPTLYDIPSYLVQGPFSNPPIGLPSLHNPLPGLHIVSQQSYPPSNRAPGTFQPPTVFPPEPHQVRFNQYSKARRSHFQKPNRGQTRLNHPSRPNDSRPVPTGPTFAELRGREPSDPPNRRSPPRVPSARTPYARPPCRRPYHNNYQERGIHGPPTSQRSVERESGVLDVPRPVSSPHESSSTLTPTAPIRQALANDDQDWENGYEQPEEEAVPSASRLTNERMPSLLQISEVDEEQSGRRKDSIAYGAYPDCNPWS